MLAIAIYGGMLKYNVHEVCHDLVSDKPYNDYVIEKYGKQTVSTGTYYC